ncbi:MAG: hypothetical protein QM666_00965 [Acinetobacter sp.]
MSRIDTIAVKDGDGYRMINADRFNPEQHKRFEGEIVPLATTNANTVRKDDDTLIAVQERLSLTEEQLATIKGEFIAFQNDVDVMTARIAELQAGTATTPSVPTEGIPDASWTAEQIKPWLAAKEIGYKSSASKAELLALVPKG